MSLSKTECASVQDLNDSGCVQDSSVCDNGYKKQAQLLDLSDDVLLYILEYCSPRDLKALGFTCSRLAGLICDHTLWQRVDCRDSSTGQQRLRWLINHCLCNTTTELKIKGYVNTKIRCLGIHSAIPCPRTGNMMPGPPGYNMVDNILYRMWYPHLPRYTVSPQWPDSNELANTDNIDKTNRSDLNQSSNKMDEDASAGEPGSSVQGQPASTIQGQPSVQGQPASTIQGQPSVQGQPASTIQGQPSVQGQPASTIQGQPSVQGQPASTIQGQPSVQGQPASTIQGQPSVQGHPNNMNCSGPISLKCDKENSSKASEPGSSNDKLSSTSNNEPSSKHVEPSSKHVEPSSKHVKPASSHCQANILSNGEPCALAGKAEPMDVTMLAGSSRPGPCISRPKPSANCPGPHFPFTVKLMRDLKYTCANLTSLFIEYCDIDYKTTNLSMFPPKLKKLSLRGTRCYNQPLHSSYLCKIQDHLRDLEYLDVSACDWFEPASLMPLSKVPKLKELYLCRCIRLTECVAYASLAARYGFRKLRVLDARGSPLADSEVSALGWLPLLEELYVAPPTEDATPPEHMHGWAESLPTFRELDHWETEEPEYFKSKSCEVPDSPPPEETNGTTDPQSSGIAEIRELRPSDAVGDRPWGCYERRIIVIQPNANREMVVQPNDNVPAMLLRRPDQPPPAVPLKRPHSDQALDLVKRPRFDDGAVSNRGASTSRECADNPNDGANRPHEGSIRPDDGAFRPTHRASRRNRICIRENHLDVGVSRSNEEVNRPNEGEYDADDWVDDINVERPDNINEVLECRMRHLHNTCPLGNRSARSAHVLMQMGTASGETQAYHNHSYDLVTDSAVFRFGRGANEHVVHLGRPPVEESLARPDRSNLRILSVTGFRNITDRSLVHLATAAPYLRLVDFTQTNVTVRGVDIFKAMRPDCEVKHSKFANYVK